MSKKKKENSNPVGRPTKYKPEYCELLIAHMSEGYSFESFAAVVNSYKETIYTWTEKHPEFMDAKKIAFEKCRMKWEKIGMEGLWSTTETSQDGRIRTTTSKALNTGVYVINMKNRFKWTDRVEIETPKETKITLAYSLPGKKEDEPKEE